MKYLGTKRSRKFFRAADRRKQHKKALSEAVTAILQEQQPRIRLEEKMRQAQFTT